MLKPVLLPALVLGTIWTFNNLNVIWLVTDQGLPADKTHILVTYVYKAAFFYYRYGYAAAFSVFIFLVLMFIVRGYDRASRQEVVLMARGRRAARAWEHGLGARAGVAVRAVRHLPDAAGRRHQPAPGRPALHAPSLRLIPDDATFDAYRIMFTEKPFLLLAAQFAAGVAGHGADRRGAGQPGRFRALARTASAGAAPPCRAS